MQSVINKIQLINILKENRKNHQKVFDEAQVGYRKQVIKMLDESLAEAKEGKRITKFRILPEPINQTKEYDRAIRMLELDTREEISLEEQEVAQYVMDDWYWKGQFSASNSAYVSANTIAKYMQ